MKRSKSIFRGLILLLLGSSFSAAYAAKKIIVLSDIHVMAASLVDSPDNVAWQEDLANNKKMQDLSIPLFAILGQVTRNEYQVRMLLDSL